MGRFITSVISIALASILASVEGVEFRASLRCEKEEPMSFDHFEQYCNELTGLGPNGFKRVSDNLEDYLKQVQQCSCFLVNQRTLYMTLLKPTISTLYYGALDGLELSRNTPSTNLDLLQNSHVKFVTERESYKYMLKNTKGKLSATMKDNKGEIARALCLDLSKKFGLFRKYLLKLAGMTDNVMYPLFVATHEENLAKLMVVSDVCYGAFKVDVAAVADGNSLTKLKST